MSFSEGSLIYYRSTNDLGGTITGNALGDDVLHAVFPKVTKEEAAVGGTQFAGAFVKNIHTIVDALNLRIMVVDDTTSAYTSYAVGFDPAPVNQSMQVIEDRNDRPDGVVWSSGSRPQDAAVLGANLKRNGGYIGVWFQRIVKAGAQEFLDDTAQVALLTDNLQGAAPLATGLPVPPIIPTIVTGEFDINWIWSILMNNAAYRNALRMLTTGNIYGSMDDPPRDASSWTSMFGDVMRGLTNITFGQKDVLYPNVANALRDHFGLRRTYYSNDVGNIHYLHMDTSDPNTVPYDASSNQYRFVLADLKAAFANPRINWIIATTNRAPYAAAASPSAQKYIDATLRDTYHPIFDKYVDIWNAGTYANLQRHHILQYNPNAPADPITLQTDEIPNYTVEGNTIEDGVLLLIVGTGGADPDTIESIPASLAYGQSVKYGNVLLNLDNLNNKMTGLFYDQFDKLDKDFSFTITKV